MATPTAAQQTAIANIYIALFNRAPDAEGFAFWTQALANGASLDTITRGFVSTPESQAIYPASQTAAQFVTAYYTNVLGRPIDADGLAFWTNLLENAGGVGSVAARALVVAQIVEIVNTPLPVKPAEITDTAYALTFADRNAFHNKGVVAVYFASEYKGTDLTLAKQVLSVVGPTTSTIDVAKALLNPPTDVGGGGGGGGVTPPVVVAPMHFVGTIDVDNFVGGAGDDTFEFVIDNNTLANTTLTSKDVITGGAGNDTLTVTITGAISNTDFAKADSITGIETVIFKPQGASNLSYTAGAAVTAVTLDGGSGVVTITNLLDGAKFLAKDTSSGNKITAEYADAVAADVTVSGVNGNYLQVNTAATSMTLTSTGAASSLSALNVGPNLSSIKIVADSAFATAYLNGGSKATVEVSGAATVNLGELKTAAVAQVNASANTGGLTATLHTANPQVTVLGSQGNDTITTGIVLTGIGSIDAGDGSGDRLIVTNSTAVADSTLGGKYTHFEVLQVANGVSVDLDHIAGITSVEINDGNGATGVSNLSAAQAAAVTILAADGNGALSIGVKGATTGGQVDTVKASVTTSGGGSAPDVNLSGLTLTGIEKLELTGNGAGFGNDGLLSLDTTNATSLDSIIVKDVGVAFITVAAGHTATDLSIDASGAAGQTRINASAYNTSSGVTIKGGAGGGELTGSAKADTIQAGPSSFSGSVTTLTGGAGADTFVFSTPDNGTTHGVITAIVTDFLGGTDKIQLTAGGPTGLSTFVKAGGAVADLATLLTAADAALDGTVHVYVGQIGANSYVVTDADGTGYTEVIQLTGVALGGIQLTDFVGATLPV